MRAEVPSRVADARSASLRCADANRVFLVAVAGLFVSCRVCTQVLCFDTLSLEVRAPDGGLVEQFRGTVTLDGQDVPFECPRLPLTWSASTRDWSR